MVEQARKRRRGLSHITPHIDRTDGLKNASFRDTVASFRYAGTEPPKIQPGESPAKKQRLTPSVTLDASKDRRIPQGGCISAGAQSEQRKVSRKSSSTYIAPSHYAHLPLLSDVLAPDLLVLFIGLNPGITTSQAGHAYAHPSNLFWKLLFTSGITDRRCAPEEDVNMPELYQLGFTNIVSRPTKDQSQLSKSEMVDGAPLLEAKAKEWRPEVCCLVGKGIWEAVYKSRHGRTQSKDDFNYGWQDDVENMGQHASYPGAKVFVAASTSGASASLRPHEKEAIWKPLGDWVKSRRAGR